MVKVASPRFPTGFATMPLCENGCGPLKGPAEVHRNLEDDCGDEGRRFAGFGVNVGYHGLSKLPGLRGAGQKGGLRRSMPGQRYSDAKLYYGTHKSHHPGHGRRFAGFSGDPNVLHGHGQWKDRSGFARGGRGWKPDVRSLHQSHTRPVPWGRLGLEDPQNVTGDPLGFNRRMFRNRQDLRNILDELGYSQFGLEAAVATFQSDYNFVSQRTATQPSMKKLPWQRVPRGNLVKDGDAGHRTLAALEIAIRNQRSGLPWADIVAKAKSRNSSFRKHIYSAK